MKSNGKEQMQVSVLGSCPGRIEENSSQMQLPHHSSVMTEWPNEPTNERMNGSMDKSIDEWMIDQKNEEIKERRKEGSKRRPYITAAFCICHDSWLLCHPHSHSTRHRRHLQTKSSQITVITPTGRCKTSYRPGVNASSLVEPPVTHVPWTIPRNQWPFLRTKVESRCRKDSTIHLDHVSADWSLKLLL